MTSALPAGTVLGGRYRVDRTLGAGATATVYLAEDLKYGRRVAVKVLDPGVAAAVGPERFLHEIEVAAQFAHPHILPLHDSGAEDGLLYYVTPYVEGESLRHRLQHQKQLPIDEALRLTRQVATALDYAHRQGVVHRDVKPENILLQDGEALVADFGVARAIAAAGADSLTQTGVILGTPAYMSPEQIAGRQDLDGRSDLYSLGCVLYEMLTGESPFTAPTMESSLSRRLTEEPPRTSSRRARVPAALDTVIAKALSRTPADRYSTGARFAEAIAAATDAVPGASGQVFVRRRWVWMAAGAVIVIALAFVALSQRGRLDGTTTRVPRLVVLPFENLGGSEDAYFADGITDEITARLASVSGLAVIARQSAVRYKNSEKTPQQIGQELDADYLLEATVSWQRDADGRSRIRVRPQLIRATDASHVWADIYDEDLKEVFSVQSRIAQSVINGLGIALLDRERVSLSAAPTLNRDAHDHYLRGVQYANQSEPFDERNYRIAIPLFEKAADLDPQFAGAHAALARAHLSMYWYAADRTEQRLATGKRALDRALALAPQLLEAQLSHAFYFYNRFEYAEALRILTALRQTYPHNADVLFNIGLVLRRQGNMSEAVTRMEEAVGVNPRAPMMVYNVGETYLLLRQHEAAEAWLTRAISFSPNSPSFYSLRARNLVAWKGATADAWPALEGADRAGVGADHRVALERVSLHLFDRNFAQAMAAAGVGASDSAFETQFRFVPRALWLGELYHVQNLAAQARTHYENARRLLEKRAEDSPSDPRYWSSLGVAYAGLGRAPEAIRTATQGVTLLPPEKEAYRGAYALEALARVYVITGDKEGAISQLKKLLAVPSHMSAAVLRLDPRWDPLRGHPGFEELVRAK